MDLFWPIIICMICLILFSICGWCCKSRREGTVYGYGTNVTVVNPPVGGNSPYPPPQMGPGGPPQPGYGQMPQGQHQPYPPGPGGPYPPAGPTPYPPAGPAPYPPAQFGAEPPPYHVAMNQPPPHNPTATEAYGKQAPYNPSYNS